MFDSMSQSDANRILGQILLRMSWRSALSQRSLLPVSPLDKDNEGSGKEIATLREMLHAMSHLVPVPKLLCAKVRAKK